MSSLGVEVCVDVHVPGENRARLAVDDPRRGLNDSRDVVGAAVKICALAEAAGVAILPPARQMYNYHLVASQAACPMA